MRPSMPWTVALTSPTRTSPPHRTGTTWPQGEMYRSCMNGRQGLFLGALLRNLIVAGEPPYHAEFLEWLLQRGSYRGQLLEAGVSDILQSLQSRHILGVGRCSCNTDTNQSIEAFEDVIMSLPINFSHAVVAETSTISMQITITNDLITVQVAVVRSDLERTVADTEVGYGGVSWGFQVGRFGWKKETPKSKLRKWNQTTEMRPFKSWRVTFKCSKCSRLSLFDFGPFTTPHSQTTHTTIRVSRCAGQGQEWHPSEADGDHGEDWWCWNLDPAFVQMDVAGASRW